MKTIFITGASAGLGKATAKLFAENGWRVIATMRNPEKEQELNTIKNITLLPLDVTNKEQIQQTVQQATAIADIDVVFNNAGYGLIAPLEATRDEQMTRQFDTNVFGVIRVTQAFIPYFRTKGRGLFITTTSIAGFMGLPLSSIYNATKWAIEGWTEGLSFELNQLGIGIKTVAPGGIKTDFISRGLDTSSHAAYEEMTQKLYNGFNPDHFTPAEEIAKVVLEAATDGRNQLRYRAGNDAVSLYAQREQSGSEVFKQEIERFYFGN
jgi:NAD(P)-dependent dehydrogenase (short-subunit alcohol dehydrogenase family)